MAKTSAIQWCDASHNFWFGCTKVSGGCKNCYAERDMKRYGRDFSVLTRSKGFDKPLNWKEPLKIFINSWSDFFHPDAPLQWVDDAWEIVRKTPRHTYLLLTKREHLIKNNLPDDWGDGWDNVWLGVSIENDDYMHRAIPLEDIQAKVKFVSAEPLLGPLPNLYVFSPTISWCIVGGESGPNARPMDLDWVRDIRDQCLEHEIKFFYKQAGGSKKINGAWGGRELDGRTWNEFPDE